MEALNRDMYFNKNTYHTTPTPALFKSGVKEIFKGFESTFPMDVWLMVNGRKPTTTRITITRHKDDQANFISKVEDEYEGVKIHFVELKCNIAWTDIKG